MKALFFREHGGIEKLQFGEIAEPKIGAGEVLLRVKACALNHLDLWVLEGWPGLKLPMPHVGGSDIAGVIEKIGADVSGCKVGDEVVVNPGYADSEDEWTKRGEESLSPSYKLFGEHRSGGFAEFINVPAKCLLKKPAQFSFAESCAPLLVATTSYRMLVRRAALKAGETVLIIGAGGGVNSFSIQLAKVLGARVIALTSSPEKMKRAEALGADTVINYREQPDWSRAVRDITNKRGVDVVVDNVGAKTMQQSLLAVCRGGRIVTVGNTSGPKLEIDNRYIFTKQISLLGSTMGSAEDFRDVMDLVSSGKIKPIVDRELPLAQGADGYGLLKKGEQFGKVVLLP